MANNVLMALDNSKNSLKAIKYVATTIKPTGKVTMLSVLPDPMAACKLEAGPSLIPIFNKNIEAFCTIEDAKKAAVEGFLDEGKKTLVKAGFPPKNISIRVRKKKAGIARDVLKEAERGKYDTLVVGRRGLSGIQQLMLGSVSNKIVHLAKNLSVILV
jgi:nucleotide-binding universal stress UspA family protein